MFLETTCLYLWSCALFQDFVYYDYITNQIKWNQVRIKDVANIRIRNCGAVLFSIYLSIYLSILTSTFASAIINLDVRSDADLFTE